MDETLQNAHEEIARLHAGLGELDYYEFLDVGRSADFFRLRGAYHDRAQRFHPDRFVASRDGRLQEMVYAVYKRMTEAYNVLSDPIQRRAYDEALRSGEHRLGDEIRGRRRPADERELSNPLTRAYYRSARLKLEAGEIIEAWIDCRLARSMDTAPMLETLEQQIKSHAASAGLDLEGDDS